MDNVNLWITRLSSRTHGADAAHFIRSRLRAMLKTDTAATEAAQVKITRATARIMLALVAISLSAPATGNGLSQMCRDILVGDACRSQTGNTCVSLRGSTAQQIANTLSAQGITFVGPTLGVFRSENCVGWRPDLMGTQAGASCLLQLLPPQFRLENPTQGIRCRTDGFPYNILTTEATTGEPPAADAGPNQRVVDVNGDGGESAALDGTGSSDASNYIKLKTELYKVAPAGIEVHKVAKYRNNQMIVYVWGTSTDLSKYLRNIQNSKLLGSPRLAYLNMYDDNLPHAEAIIVPVDIGNMKKNYASE